MNNQYFMYGILVLYDTYLETRTMNTVDDVLNGDDDIQGIFTARNGDFMIIGKRMNISNAKSPIRVPELTELEVFEIENTMKKKFGLEGEFYYYFIKK